MSFVSNMKNSFREPVEGKDFGFYSNFVILKYIYVYILKSYVAKAGALEKNMETVQLFYP